MEMNASGSIKIDSKNLDDKWIYIMSFDIGEKNFTFFIDRYMENRLKDLKSRAIPYQQRYDKNGECQQEFREFLHQLSSCGERIHVEKFDMTSIGDLKAGKRRIITTKLLVRFTNYLDTINSRGLFDPIHYFLIEEQVKKAENNRQIQFHLRAYLIKMFLDFRPIICFPSYYKTRILGAPKKISVNPPEEKIILYEIKDDVSNSKGLSNNKLITKKTKLKKCDYAFRKKWSIEMAKNILILRGDEEGVHNIFTKKVYGKPDDVGDCLLQIVSFINLLFIDDKYEILN
jgi:hypothetical protein